VDKSDSEEQIQGVEDDTLKERGEVIKLVRWVMMRILEEVEGHSQLFSG
jgi:hypothetical protein